MHLPIGREKHRDVGIGHVVRRAIGAVQNADLPPVAVRRSERKPLRRPGDHPVHIEHIAGPQNPSAMATKLAQGKRRPAAQILGHIEPAAHRQIRPNPRAHHLIHPQRGTRLHRDRLPARDAFAIELSFHVRTCQRDHRVRPELQRRAGHRAFQPRRMARIAHQTVRQLERQRIHRTRRRHADFPIAQPAGVILHRRLRAPVEDVNGLRQIIERVQVTRRHHGIRKHGGTNHLPQILDIGRNPGHPGLGQRRLHLRNRRRPILRRHDHFRDHRVIERRHLRAAFHPRFDARIRRETRRRQPPRRGPETLPRVFGINADLDRRAANCRALQLQFARRLPHHPLHQIDTRNLFGYPVLHLQPRVHFEEVELPGVGVVKELDCPRVGIVHGPAQPFGRAEQLRPHALGQVRRRGLLHHFLIPPLQRTIAFAEGDHLALAIAKNLHFDVPRPRHELLDEHAAVFEVGRAQPLHRLVSRGQLCSRETHLHPDAPAPRRALQHHRIADAESLRLGHFDRSDEPRAGRQRYRVRRRQLSRRVLQSESPEMLRPRADEHDPGFQTILGKPRVFAQKTIARMNRLGPGGLRRRQYFRRVQVAFGRQRRTQQNGLVGLRHVQ